MQYHMVMDHIVIYMIHSQVRYNASITSALYESMNDILSLLYFDIHDIGSFEKNK